MPKSSSNVEERYDDIVGNVNGEDCHEVEAEDAELWKVEPRETGSAESQLGEPLNERCAKGHHVLPRKKQRKAGSVESQLGEPLNEPCAKGHHVLPGIR